MKRRNFIKNTSALAIATGLMPEVQAQQAIVPNNALNQRQYWVSILEKITKPVLEAIAKEELKKKMPVERLENAYPHRADVTHLEAFARTLTGIAPWLENNEVTDKDERAKLEQFRQLARKGLANAVNPESADYLNFTAYQQPLVDAAFLAQALLRSPQQLWHQSERKVQNQIVEALQSTRNIHPHNNNWILFTAMIEAALLRFDAGGDAVKIDMILRIMDSWYKGDGIYGDGADFHFDYYNSFVIQPFLLDILEVLHQKDPQRFKDLYEKNKKIAARYAAILEMMIAPDGTFPPVGRSVTYRFGAFQLLAQVALRQELPPNISPAQVREGLTVVIRKVMEANNFDKNGWLKIGLYGSQLQLAEQYISTGSLYLCSTVFLPLGLPTSNMFWTAPPQDWTAKKVWTGKDVPADKALRNY